MSKLKIYAVVVAVLVLASCSHPQKPSSQGGSSALENTEPTIDPAWTGQTLINNVAPDSKTVGNVELVVGPIAKNSNYDKIGLKEGDLIMKWNGKEMSGREGWAFVKNSLQSNREFTVVIERNGKEQVLHYNKSQ